MSFSNFNSGFFLENKMLNKSILLFKVAMKEKKMKNYFQQYLFLTLSPV